MWSPYRLSHDVLVLESCNALHFCQQRHDAPQSFYASEQVAAASRSVSGLLTLPASSERSGQPLPVGPASRKILVHRLYGQMITAMLLGASYPPGWRSSLLRSRSACMPHACVHLDPSDVCVASPPSCSDRHASRYPDGWSCCKSVTVGCGCYRTHPCMICQQCLRRTEGHSVAALTCL